MKLKLFVGILIGAVCLWFAFQDVSWSDVVKSLEGIQYSFLIVAVLMMPLTHLFRVWRWKTLLEPIKAISVKNLFIINAVGFLSIQVFPFRMGEFTRPILLKRHYEIPISTGLATVAVERIFDGLFSGIALFIGLLSVPEERRIPFLAISVHTLAKISIGFFGLFLVFLILTVLNRAKAFSMIQKLIRVFPSPLEIRLSGMAQNLFEGLKALPDIRHLLKVSLQSAVVWGVMAVAFGFGFFAFGLDFPWTASLTVLGLAAIGVMVPGPPGFVGTYQLFVEAAIVLYGASKVIGLAYSIVFYTINLTYIALAGLICMPMVAISMKGIFSQTVSEQVVQK